MHKGHKQFKTVVGDIEHGCLIDVLNTHKQSEVIEALMQQPSELREQVEQVSIDMWGGFPKVIKKVFPNATIVYDRFHVMQIVNRALNKLRKQLGITIKGKGSRHLLLKNAADLSSEQQAELELILNQSPCLRIAHNMKEEFRQIYENSKTPQSAQKQMQKCLKYAAVSYLDVCQTIRQHIEGICNYFISRTTSGVMEKLNNKSRVVMRQAYGFNNFDNLRLRLLAACGDN